MTKDNVYSAEKQPVERDENYSGHKPHCGPHSPDIAPQADLQHFNRTVSTSEINHSNNHLQICRLCSTSERRPVECACSFCKATCCSIHRGIFGEWTVCSNCYNAIERDHITAEPELRRLMDESKAKWKALIEKAQQFWAQERAKGRSEEELSAAICGKAVTDQWVQDRKERNALS